MRTRILSIITLLLMATTISAGPVSKQKAQSHAYNFMAKNGMKIKTAPAHIARKANGEAAYYVYNAADSKGFVIISGDDRTDAVLGYVDQGEFNPASIPENMRVWLEGYRNELEDADAESAYAPETSREDIPVLMTTLWNQNDPYNRLCPEYQGSPTYTGCVSTALAQIMKYYNYPNSLSQPLPGYQPANYSTYTSRYWTNFSPNGMPDTTFVYNDMRNYYTGSESDKSKDAVALLMQYISYAAQTNYGTNISTASVGSPVNVLRNYFDYDASVRLVARSSYSATQWDELIYAEMAAKRPVIISGSSDNGNGHQFVCDGYQNGLYHFNWGWGGYCNGYFRLTALTPKGSGIGGTSNVASGYNQGVMAVIGIQPNTHETVEEETAPVCTAFYQDEEYIHLTLAGFQPQTINYAFGIGYYEEDGTLVPISHAVFNGLRNGISTSYTFANSTVEFFCREKGRTYKIVPIYAIVDNGVVGVAPAGTVWKSFAPYSVYITFLIDADGNIFMDRYPHTDVTVSELTIEGPMTAKAQAKVKITLHNNGDEFSDNVALYVAAPGCIPMLADGGNEVVGAGDNQDIDFYFTPTREGTYTIYAVYGKEGHIIKQATIEIVGTARTTLLALGADGVTQQELEDGKTKFTFPVVNIGGALFSGSIYFDLYRIIGTSFVREISQEVEQEIQPMNSAYVEAIFDYLQAGNYQIKLANETPGGAKKDFATYNFTIEAKEAGVRSITMTEGTDNVPYYTTGGIQQQEPTNAGIYIHQGKKEIIK